AAPRARAGPSRRSRRKRARPAAARAVPIVRKRRWRCRRRSEARFSSGWTHLQALFHASDLAQEPVAARAKPPRGDSLVRAAIDHQHQIVPFFQIATEHLRVLELQRELYRRSESQATADSLDFAQEDPLVRAESTQSFGTDVEDPLGPEIDRFSFAIEKDSADGAGGRLQRFPQDGLKRHYAAPRTCSSIWMSPRRTACTNASTTWGSNRVPPKLLILSTTYDRSIAFWYGRFVVMASKVTAMAMMRACMGI